MSGEQRSIEPQAEIDRLRGLIVWAYELSEKALFARYSRADQMAREQALSQINHRFKEFA